MRLIIAGSRSMPRHIAMSFIEVHCAIQPPSVVVCGKAQGVDTWGEEWARARGVHVDPHPVLDWTKSDGRTDYAAGHRRNARMVAVADALLVIHWQKPKSGSTDVRDRARVAGLLVVEVAITPPRYMPSFQKSITTERVFRAPYELVDDEIPF